MSRGSFGRTVARAAASGGSKSYRARPPMLWYALMVVIVLGGISLIAYSRNERLHPASAASVPPTKSDNWHAAFALDICGKLQPDLPANTDLTTAGIRTFGDGVIDIDPGAVSDSSSFTGNHATLGTFVSSYGNGFAIAASSITLPAKSSSTSTTTTTTTSPSSTSSTSTTAATSTTTTAKSTTAAKSSTTTLPKTSGAKGAGIRAGEAATTSTAATSTTTASSTSSSSPSSSTSSSTTTTVPTPKGPTYTNGQSCPATSPAPGRGRLVAEVWPSTTGKGHLVTKDLAGLKLANGQMITVAFVPTKTAIPEPPSKQTLITDLGGASTSGSK